MSKSLSLAETNDELMWNLIARAEQAGIKLEVVGGAHTWEAFPKPRHQKAVKRIEGSITRTAGHEGDCACYSLADVYLKLPDGSIKRPDIAIFCSEPPEMDDFIAQVPKAVVEVISAGYEQKDLEDGPRLYLSQGVLDVLVFDPFRDRLHHFDENVVSIHSSPVTIQLKCGCTLCA